MAYSSLHGRKPMERASKISHSNVIASTAVQALLARCSIPRPAEANTLNSLLQDVPLALDQKIRAIVAVDGSMREVPVREEFPSAAITFFTFGPLLFKLEDLRELNNQTFIAPEDMARLKKIQRFVLVLPTRNISLNGLSLRDSVRRTLHEFFLERHADDDPLYKTLRWILFRGWITGGEKFWDLPHCPNYGCTRDVVRLVPLTPDEHACEVCGKPIYLIDACRLHERVPSLSG